VRVAAGKIEVFTFKEGLLSRAAHDLHFDLGRFQITLEGDDLQAQLDLDSLRLIGPVEDGETHPQRYDAGKRADVERAMRQEVLHLERHPIARFTGRALARGGGYRVDGQLQLAGRTAPLAFDVDRRGHEYHARFELRPSEWGIPQYRAMLGTIRLRDLIRVEATLTER
jgi:polyisoprenoid-binding protein YceI